MTKIFVTGGIGSGKSTLMDFLHKQGAATIYADEVGRNNLYLPQVRSQIQQVFGADVFDEAGEVITHALAQKAFASPQATAQLDAITLPVLYEGCLAALDKAAATHDVVVLEMAILDGRDDFAHHADLVIAVVAPVEARIAHLVKERGFSEADVRSRLARQVSDEKRIALADVVFTNDATLAEFEQHILQWWQAFQQARQHEKETI